MVSWFKKQSGCENTYTISVRVKPKSSRSCVLGVAHSGTEIEVALRAPPVDGAANEELIALFSKTLGVRKSDIEITIGQSSRVKVLLVSRVSDDAVRGLGVNLCQKSR